MADKNGERRSESGLPLKPYYQANDLPGAEEPPPGEFPYTRGIYPDMYRGRHWTMRQYSGFATAAESNRRYRKLLDAGQTGLSVAFDLVTQMGYDSDDPVAEGEVGKVGVAIDSLADMELLFKDIPLDRVSTSMTINAPAAGLMLLYQLTAEKQGVDGKALGGTVQNDILKEYAARGTYIFPPQPSMRLVTDTFAYCAAEMPRWNTISISGYHISEAGATPMQELAFTLANGIAYVDAAIEAGLKIDDFAPRLSFFFNCKMEFFEEIAKFRAARKMWAQLMRERYGAKDERSMTLRFHTQTAGSSLTSLQPHNNVVRTAVEALAAVLGGTQSLHTNGYDEAAGPAHRVRRHPGAADAAGDRQRDRDHAGGGPAGRQLPGGAPDRRPRGGRRPADRRDRRDGRLGQRHRVGVDAAPDRRFGLPLPEGGGE